MSLLPANASRTFPQRSPSPVEQLVVEVLGSLHVGANGVHDLNQLLQLLLQTLAGAAPGRHRGTRVFIGKRACTYPFLCFVACNQALVPFCAAFLQKCLHNHRA